MALRISTPGSHWRSQTSLCELIALHAALRSHRSLLPSLRVITMSPPPHHQSSFQQHAHRTSQATKALRDRKTVKGHVRNPVIAMSQTSPALASPTEDFILFPDSSNETSSSVNESRAQKRQKRKIKSNKPLTQPSPSPTPKPHTEEKKLTPMERRAIRHQRAAENDVAMIMASPGMEIGSMVPPPAPSPPRLPTPELDDIDDACWDCCAFSEQCVQEYIVETKRRYGK